MHVRSGGWLFLSVVVAVTMLAGRGAHAEDAATPFAPSFGHQGDITAIAWRADGALLASASRDGTIKLWDATKGALLLTLDGHADHVVALAWSHDGTALASIGNGSVFVWDGYTFALRRVIQAKDRAASVALSPDGSIVAIGSDVGSDRGVPASGIERWETETGKSLPTLGTDEPIRGLWWSPVGSLLVQYSYNGAFLWDNATGTSVAQAGGSNAGWSPDGSIFLTACPHDQGGTLEIHDGHTGALLRKIEGHGECGDPSFSADGTRVALPTGVLTLSTGNLVPAPERSSMLSFSPDGKHLAGAFGNRLWIGDAAGDQRRPLSGFNQAMTAVAWSPDGQILAAAGAAGVALWSMNGPFKAPLDLPGAGAVTLAFSPDGKWLAGGAMSSEAADGNGGLTVWDAASGAVRFHSDDKVGLIAWGPGDELATVAIGSTDPVLVRRGSDGKVRAKLVWLETSEDFGEADPPAIHDLRWSADGKSITMFASGSEARTRTFDAHTGKLLSAVAPKEPQGLPPASDPLGVFHSDELDGVVAGLPFAAHAGDDGRRWIQSCERRGTCSYDGPGWILLDEPGGAWRAAFTEPVNDLAWQPAGRVVAAAVAGGVRIVRVSDGASLWLVQATEPGHRYHAAFTDDGAHAGEGGAERILHLADQVVPDLIPKFLGPPPPLAPVDAGAAHSLRDEVHVLRSQQQDLQAIARADELVRRSSADPALAELVGEVLIERGRALYNLERRRRVTTEAAAAASFSEVVRRLGDSTTLPARELVALALEEKARVWQARTRTAADATRDGLIARFTTASEPELRGRMAMALLSRCVDTLEPRDGDQVRPADEPSCFALVRGFAKDTAPEVTRVLDLARAKLAYTVGDARKRTAWENLVDEAHSGKHHDEIDALDKELHELAGETGQPARLAEANRQRRAGELFLDEGDLTNASARLDLAVTGYDSARKDGADLKCCTYERLEPCCGANLSQDDCLCSETVDRNLTATLKESLDVLLRMQLYSDVLAQSDGVRRRFGENGITEEWWLARAQADAGLGQTKEALAAFDSAVKLAGKKVSAETLVARGRFLASTGHLADALASYRAAAHGDGLDEQAYLEQGRLLVALHQESEAVGSFSHVYANNPSPEIALDALLEKARALHTLGKVDREASVYQEAHDQAEDSSTSYSPVAAAGLLLAEATMLDGMKQPLPAARLRQQLLIRYADSPDPAMAPLVKQAMELLPH